MFVITRVQIRLPYKNEYIETGAKLEVVDVNGRYYVCEYKNRIVMVNKNDCEEVKGE